MKSPETIIALASKQTWPHVSAVLRFRPKKLVLLHTNNEGESGGPAKRLKQLFIKEGCLAEDVIDVKEIPHDDVHAIIARMNELNLPQQNAAVNFTGGNKLMALATFFWANKCDLPSFYLERKNLLLWFTFSGRQVETEREPLDIHLADSIDPMNLLICQLGEDALHHRGQGLRLNLAGNKSVDDLLGEIPRSGEPPSFITRLGTVIGPPKTGDLLEWETATVLLKLGVQKIQRSVHLGTKPTGAHSEIDLLFNYGGNLWCVECKDQAPRASIVGKLERLVQPRAEVNVAEVTQLFEDLRKKLRENETKEIKEDLFESHEVGGLLGRAVWVLKSAMEPGAESFARQYNVELVNRNNLVREWENLLRPSFQ